MKNIIYSIALSSAALTSPAHIICDGLCVKESSNYEIGTINSRNSATSDKIADNRQYLNSMLIKTSLYERLTNKNIVLTNPVEMTFNGICEKCGCFDIKEVYADYSPISNAIRLDMIIDNDFLLIVRKTMEDEDDGVAVSVSKGNVNYLADYIKLDELVKEVTNSIKG